MSEAMKIWPDSILDQPPVHLKVAILCKLIK